MIRYKLDILEELKAVGYTTYRLRREKLLAEGEGFHPPGAYFCH